MPKYALEKRAAERRRLELTRKRIAIIVVVGLVVLAAVVIPTAYFAAEKDSGEENPQKQLAKADRRNRVDCFPEASSPAVKLTKEECERRGCQFDAEAAANATLGVGCYYPAEGGLRYSVAARESTSQGFRLHLKSSGPAPFPAPFRKPVLDVHMVSNSILRFTFDNRCASPPRFRVPIPLNLPTTGADKPEYHFKVTDEAKLSFTITRNSTGTVIFDTDVGNLVLTDQFLQLSARLPSTNVYGMGEHMRSTFRRRFDWTSSWPAFARDQFPGADNSNLYGVYSFYTCVEDSEGHSHGVFLFNTNAQEYVFSPGPTLTWRTIGGVLDFLVFIGSDSEDVVKQYLEMTGRPMLPPYWALGFQLSRYGYNNVTSMQKAVEETKAYNIPVDVQYADIDHMDGKKDFTVDPVNFGGLSDYFDTLRAGGMRTIIILNPALISNETGYKPYDEIKKVKGFVMWPPDFDVPANSADDDGALLGLSWPKGKVVFADFFKNATQRLWVDLIVEHHANISFDGLWVDMNEPTNFGTNLEELWLWPSFINPFFSLHCGDNQWDDPPYRPLAAYFYDKENYQVTLADKTICMNAVQGEQGQYRHYDVHSLYGWSQIPPTLRGARAATGERSLVISRSTFPGSGQYAGHWLGDNTSKWSHLRQSIVGMLDFSLFGIPLIGADICGFLGEATEELCLRWMQLGAFYPFSRNHNAIGMRDQNPGAFGDEVGTASREIMETRYWLLPYLYTLFYNAHTRGDTVVRPLHHEFTTDKRTLDIDRQFLWGPALLISPILEQNQKELKFYLPHGRWYHFYTGEMSLGPAEEAVTVDSTCKPELHLRGGHIIVLQEPANNTHFSRQNPLEIRVMMDPEKQEARGTVFWDDGVSIDTVESGMFTEVVYVAKNGNLKAHASHNNFAGASSLHYERVIVYGVTSVSNVTITMGTGGNTYSPTFDVNNGVLNVTLDSTVNKLSEDFEVTWQ